MKNRKDNNSNSKVHFKMYKAKKKWMLLGLTTLGGIIGGYIVSPGNASALADDKKTKVATDDILATANSASIPAESESTSIMSNSTSMTSSNSNENSSSSSTQVMEQRTESQETSQSNQNDVEKNNVSESTVLSEKDSGGSQSTAEESNNSSESPSVTNNSSISSEAKAQQSDSTEPTSTTSSTSADSALDKSSDSIIISEDQTVQSTASQSNVDLLSESQKVVNEINQNEKVLVTNKTKAEMTQSAKDSVGNSYIAIMDAGSTPPPYGTVTGDPAQFLGGYWSNGFSSQPSNQMTVVDQGVKLTGKAVSMVGSV